MVHIEMDYRTFVHNLNKFTEATLIPTLEQRNPVYKRGKAVLEATQELLIALAMLDQALRVDTPKKYTKEAALTVLPHEKEGNPGSFVKIMINTHILNYPDFSLRKMTDAEALKVLTL